MGDTVLRVENLKVYFPVKGGLFTKKQVVKAADGVSFKIYPRETFGLVGESGCGRGTADRAVIKLYEPTSGTVCYHGEDVTRIKGSHLVEFRRSVQMIFQDPYASLDPRMTVGEIIREPMDIHHILNMKEGREQRVCEPLDIIGLESDHIHRYLHEFSDGQYQRIRIAKTLALNPQLIVRNEPISVLGVSIQAQAINLLEHIQKEMGIPYLFIAYNLSMVKHIPDRIDVMCLGDLVKVGDSDDMYRRPPRPYTQALLSAVPIPDPHIAREKKRIVLEGELPSPLDIPSGCVFRIRCFNTTERCAREKPRMVSVGKRAVVCFLYEK